MFVEVYVSPRVEMSASKRVDEADIVRGVAQLESRLDAAFTNLLQTALENRVPVPVVDWHVHDQGSPIWWGRENAGRRWDIVYVAPKIVATVDVPDKAVVATWLVRFQEWAQDVKDRMNERLPAGVRVDRIVWREKAATGLEGTG